MTADPTIVQYIKEQVSAGYRKAQIYDALLQAGWYKEEIDAAFYEVVKQSSFAPEPVQLRDSSQPKPKKPRSRRKVVVVAIAAALVISAVVLMGFFNPLDYIFPKAPGAIQGPGNSEGFSNIGMANWHYQYGGGFSITFLDIAPFPITINSVAAECGQPDPVVLETMDPTHLETGANITYSTGDENCASKEPQESYSVAVTIRYINGNNDVVSSTGTVSGRAE